MQRKSKRTDNAASHGKLLIGTAVEVVQTRDAAGGDGGEVESHHRAVSCSGLGVSN